MSSSNVAKTIRPAIKRSGRIVPYLALKAHEFVRRDVWEVGDDPVERPRGSRKEIRFMKVDPH